MLRKISLPFLSALNRENDFLASIVEQSVKTIYTIQNFLESLLVY